MVQESNEQVSPSLGMTGFEVERRVKKHSRLGFNARMIARAIAQYHDAKRGYAYPSWDVLMRETGVSKTTLFRATEEMVNSGEWTRDSGRGGRARGAGRNTQYRPTALLLEGYEDETHEYCGEQCAGSVLTPEYSQQAEVEPEVLEEVNPFGDLYELPQDAPVDPYAHLTPAWELPEATVEETQPERTSTEVDLTKFIESLPLSVSSALSAHEAAALRKLSEVDRATFIAQAVEIAETPEESLSSTMAKARQGATSFGPAFFKRYALTFPQNSRGGMKPAHGFVSAIESIGGQAQHDYSVATQSGTAGYESIHSGLDSLDYGVSGGDF